MIIDGRFVMEDGVIPGTDPAADAARAQAQFDRLVAKISANARFGHPPVERDLLLRLSGRETRVMTTPPSL